MVDSSLRCTTNTLEVRSKLKPAPNRFAVNNVEKVRTTIGFYTELHFQLRGTRIRLISRRERKKNPHPTDIKMIIKSGCRSICLFILLMELLLLRQIKCDLSKLLSLSNLCLIISTSKLKVQSTCAIPFPFLCYMHSNILCVCVCIIFYNIPNNAKRSSIK